MLFSGLRRSARFAVIAAMLVLGTLASPAAAQGLVWNLPESGTAVRYSGDYRQVTFRPQSEQGDISLQWRRVLEIRCLDRESAEFQGENIPCVWLEYEVTTGQQVDGVLEAGPGGTRIYKVLVPESAINGLEFFQADVPHAFVPVVKGFQKIGNRDAEPFALPVLQVFPLLSQVLLNEHLTVAGEETVNITAGEYDCQRVDCQTNIEDLSSRVTNFSQVWISDAMPLGTVQWKVRIDREVKTEGDSRDEFQKRSEITIDMQAVEILSDAVSKLNTQ
ncbi:hypothetical protein [Rubinisphaera margarita]|uniref:hypothetical protein n=1 Tax=Rubinisphaera margarita TaxID=2909586 RepID=UPI001EE95988|nr:hypothetical protein [Rubinisphaera margarita]MCG6154733.1 hypothetical protein [Rubinisphaera margarita]